VGLYIRKLAKTAGEKNLIYEKSTEKHD